MGTAITIVVLFSVGIPMLTFLVGWSLPKPSTEFYQRILFVGTVALVVALILLGLIATVVSLIAALAVR